MGSVMFETGFVQLRGPIKGRCPSIQIKGAFRVCYRWRRFDLNRGLLSIPRLARLTHNERHRPDFAMVVGSKQEGL